MTAPAPSAAERRAAYRTDNWQSLLLGLGSTRDKISSFSFTSDTYLDDETLDALYHQDAIAARICDARPLEMLRQGIDITIAEDEEEADETPGTSVVRGPTSKGMEPAEMVSAMHDELRRLGAQEKFVRAMIFGNLFGGSAIIIGANDGENDLSKPLQLERVRSVDFLTVLDRRSLKPTQWYSDPLKANYGRASHYEIRPRATPASALYVVPNPEQMELHESRLILFGGAMTSDSRKRDKQGWDWSVLDRVYETLRQFQAAFAGAAHLASDASQAVFKVKDLQIMVAQGDGDLVARRVELQDRTRSSGRAIVIDAEGESFERIATQFSGLPELLESFMLKMAADADMPVEVLMHQSPSGLNATGESAYRMWTDSIRCGQLQYLKPRLEILVEVLWRAKQGPTRGREPSQWDIDFPPLRQASPSEEAALRNQIAQTDILYLTNGVITVEELRTSRFRPEGYSTDLIIDLDDGGDDDALRSADQAILDRLAGRKPMALPGAPLALPEHEGEPAPSPEAKSATEALNGGQITSMLAIVQAVADKKIPRESGAAMLTASFPLDDAQAEAILGDAGLGFEAVKAPSPFGGGGGPPVPPKPDEKPEPPKPEPEPPRAP